MLYERGPHWWWTVGLGAVRSGSATQTLREEHQEALARLTTMEQHLAELVGRIFAFMQDIGRATSGRTLRVSVSASCSFILPVLQRLADGGGEESGDAKAMDLTNEALCAAMLEEIRVLPRLEAGLLKMLENSERESHAARNWLVYGGFAVSFLATARFLYMHSSYNNSWDLQRWLHTAKDNWHNFTQGHLYEPARAIYKELFGLGHS
jgi:hypothetical protein